TQRTPLGRTSSQRHPTQTTIPTSRASALARRARHPARRPARGRAPPVREEARLGGREHRDLPGRHRRNQGVHPEGRHGRRDRRHVRGRSSSGRDDEGLLFRLQATRRGDQHPPRRADLRGPRAGEGPPRGAQARRAGRRSGVPRAAQRGLLRREQAAQARSDLRMNVTDGKVVAWLGFGFGSVISIAGNVLHAWLPADPPSIAAQIGAAAWSIALLLSVEAISRVRWRSGWLWGLARYVGLGVVGLGSFAISYGHMSEVLTAWGYGMGAYVGPIVIDGLMVISGFALLSES